MKNWFGYDPFHSQSDKHYTLGRLMIELLYYIWAKFYAEHLTFRQVLKGAWGQPCGCEVQ